MNYSALRSKGETVVLFCKNPIAPAILVYKIVLSSIQDITASTPFSSENIIDDVYKITITLPNEDCYLLIETGLSGNVLRVGNPEQIYLYISSGFLTGLSIPYRHIDFYGNVLSSGMLQEIGFGAYVYLISANSSNETFIDVDNTMAIIRPVPTVGFAQNFTIKTSTYNIKISYKQAT